MKIKYIIFAFIVVGLLFRVVQYQHALFSDWDEGIYAEVAADMVERNSYILPEFNSQPWLDKPPVVGMLIAGAFKLFPEHKELASRATMAFVAIGLLAFLYILSKRITTFFFAEKLNSLSEWMRELVFFSPLFATALTPVFLDRAIRLNTDSLLAVSWLGYFVARESFQGKFAAIIIGTWTKSVAGFYPMVFDIFSFFTLKNKTKNIGLYIALIVSGFSWLILNYFVYGHDFIKAHIQDQLFKRVTVPIELHFGGRLFYPEFLVKELSFVLVIMICSYLIITFDILKKLRPENGISFFKKLTSFIQSPSCALYVLLLSPLPFFVLLTFAKSKIWWYMILIIPFFALSIPYGLMRVRNNTLRMIVAISIFAFFLFRFLPATYALKTVQDSPDKLRVAQCVGSIPSDRVLIMVNEQERKNRNVVEAAQLQTYSSFMYGGAPSFVYYAHKKVEHYYRVEELNGRLISGGTMKDLLVISKDDMIKDEFSEARKALLSKKKETTCYFGEWEVYQL